MQIGLDHTILYWFVWFKRILKEPWMLRPLKQQGVPFGPTFWMGSKNGQMVLEDEQNHCQDFIPKKVSYHYLR